MGWPGCMWEGCKNWPSVGFTGVCHECIKHPDRVAIVASKMYENVSSHDRDRDADFYRFAWMTNDPERCLKMVLTLLEDGEKDVRAAFDKATRHYWSTGSQHRSKPDGR